MYTRRSMPPTSRPSRVNASDPPGPSPESKSNNERPDLASHSRIGCLLSRIGVARHSPSGENAKSETRASFEVQICLPLAASHTPSNGSVPESPDVAIFVPSGDIATFTIGDV